MSEKRNPIREAAEAIEKTQRDDYELFLTADRMEAIIRNKLRECTGDELLEAIDP